MEYFLRFLAFVRLNHDNDNITPGVKCQGINSLITKGFLIYNNIGQTLLQIYHFFAFTLLQNAIQLYAGPLEKIHIKTPEGKPFTLLNMPYFLSGKIKEYIEWMIAEG